MKPLSYSQFHALGHISDGPKRDVNATTGFALCRRGLATCRETAILEENVLDETGWRELYRCDPDDPRIVREWSITEAGWQALNEHERQIARALTAWSAE